VLISQQERKEITTTHCVITQKRAFSSNSWQKPEIKQNTIVYGVLPPAL
jgi:hypothetical protein